MEYKFEASANWERLGARNGRVEMDIKLDAALMTLARDGKESPLIAPDILNNRARLRREMFTALSTRIIPQIARDASAQAKIGGTPRQLTTDARVNSNVKSSFEQQGGQLKASNRAKVTVDLSSNRYASTAAAFNNARATIADNLASGIVQNYKAALEKDRRPTRTASSAHLKGDRVNRYDVRKAV